jgi:hypothetical protein
MIAIFIIIPDFCVMSLKSTLGNPCKFGLPQNFFPSGPEVGFVDTK